MGRIAPTLCAVCIGAGAAQLAPSAAATEREWRVGADVGYAAAGLPEGTVGGFFGGVHGTYGITDAFNLRLNADTSWYAQPPPATYAVLWSTTAGLEYVIDILSWVPTLGVFAGPAGILRKGGQAPGIVVEDRHETYFALELPLGLGYQVIDELTVGVEGRLRWLLFGTAEAPITSLISTVRAEYVWGGGP